MNNGLIDEMINVGSVRYTLFNKVQGSENDKRKEPYELGGLKKNG